MKKHKILSAALAAVMAFSGVATYSAASAEPQETVGSQYAQDTIQGGAILHCFDWSYNAIRERIPEIAAAGYTAVQTSPVQPPKDYNASWTNTSGQWWKMYQPLDLDIADGNSWLGTKDELKQLCSTAHEYGVKVVADIVFNHVANDGVNGGTFSHVHPDVASDLQFEEFYHSESTAINYSNGDRYNLTHNHMNMPDLNTGEAYIKYRALTLLTDCVKCGVDGFRFDAAKHIEVPDDPASTRSDFWDVVIGGLKEYKPDVFCYGEILGSAGNIPMSSYQRYMSITDSDVSINAFQGERTNNAAKLATSTYTNSNIPSKSVLWVESHDNYLNNGTSYYTNHHIVKTWAITGARADACSLFLDRPGPTMGVAGPDEAWKSKEVTAVNKFKNYFDGTSEYLSSYDDVAYIERGTSGVCISKLGSAGEVSLPAHTLADGVYVDQISGNTFTVSNRIIHGTVTGMGVAVVYNPASSYVQNEPGVDDILIGDANFDGTIDIKDATYLQMCLADDLIFDLDEEIAADCNGDNNLTIVDVTMIQRWLAELLGFGKVNTLYYNGEGEPPTQPTTVPSTTTTVTFTNSLGWSGTIRCYYWADDSNPVSWPGTQMNVYQQTNEYGQTVYQLDIPENADYVIFNNNSSQTVDIKLSDYTSSRFYAISSTDSLGHYEVVAW